MRYAGLFLLLSVLAACATGPSPQGQPPNPGEVHGLLLRLRTDNLDSLSAKQTEGITGQIAANLKSWGYPVSASATNPQASHILEAWVSKPERKSLPPGFSLTFGTPDQRAPDQQKTDVVTVGCALFPANGQAGKVSLSGEFGAAGSAKSIFSGLPDLGQEHFYVDRMGSVCLNLLAELKIGKVQAQESKDSSFTPAWIPDMRIEVKTKGGKSKPGVSAPAVAAPAAPAVAAPVSPAVSSPAAPKVSAPPLPAISAPKATAPAVPTPVVNPAETPAAPTAASPETPPANEPPSITTEERVNESDQRKQLIIHNQGSPIILEFGYDENRGMKW
ncbi:MAG: hypothetical protein ACKN9T_04755 [Candidatus Methylumidiphilus sp.]